MDITVPMIFMGLKRIKNDHNKIQKIKQEFSRFGEQNGLNPVGVGPIVL